MLARLLFWRETALDAPESAQATKQVVSWFEQRWNALSAEHRAIVAQGLSPKGKIHVTKAATVCKALGMFNSEI